MPAGLPGHKMDELRAQLRQVSELSSKGAFREALELADRLCLEHPDSLDAAYERACLIVLYQIPKDGLRAAEAVAERFPDSYYGPVLVAWANVRLKRGKEALLHLSAASELGAPEEVLLSLRARALALTGGRKEALRLLAGGSDLASLRAKVSLEQPKNLSELESALESLRRAGETEENLAFRRGAWYAEQRMYAAAESHLQSALADLGPSPALSVQLARIEFSGGKKDEALRRLSQVLAEHPENLQARRAMSWFSLFRGRPFAFLLHQFLLIRYGIRVDPSGPNRPT